eukprot:TRINITY_DN1215_c0_g1_i3.p1 TRINITY_DN1215_c0_g1~~TRINITY_DN1215_c0_g1_i3.p1  ORF type:complete len:452 (+),score=37.72 TRINITY_DN1215_c0_g1_i3:708-2063(+)
MFCSRCKHLAVHPILDCASSSVNSTWRKVSRFILANSQELLPVYLPNDVVHLLVDIVFTVFDLELSDLKRFNPFEFSNKMTLVKDNDGSLAYGTWTQILKWQTSSDCDDLYHNDFLWTYKTFHEGTTNLHLFSSLVERYKQGKTEVIIKHKVLGFIGAWIGKFGFDFFGSNSNRLSSKCLTWLGHLQLTEQDQEVLFVVEQLQSLIKVKQLDFSTEDVLLGQNLTINDIAEKDIENFIISDFSPQQLAHQMTLVDWKLWQMIQVEDFYVNGPSVKRMIEHFRRIAHWVEKMIQVLPPLVVISFLVEVSWEFFSIGNFNGLMYLMPGITREKAIHARHIFPELPDRIAMHYAELFEITKAPVNIKYFMENANPPCIPFVGIFQMDASFLSHTMLTDSQMINFTKKRHLAAIVSNLFKHQEGAGYEFEENQELQTRLRQEMIWAQKGRAHGVS